DMSPGLSEPDVLAEMGRLGDANVACGRDLVCFAGGGAYDHEVPSVVRRVAFRSEFVTAYTPYQPEVAQGVLQALFEYQTMITRLTGVEIANASLYDGASACVEGVNLAVAATGRQRVWLSRGVNPSCRVGSGRRRPGSFTGLGGGRRGGGGGAAVRHAAQLRRPVPRAVRLPARARAPPAGTAGGRDGRRRRPARLRHHVAHARTGHPSR